MTTELDQLNDTFAIPDHCEFCAGNGGLIKAVIRNSFASAELYLHGAHLTSFQPNGGREVLWVSDLAEYQTGKAIRGGIPICWPWFGPHPSDPDKPNHGFARTTLWEVFETTHMTNATRLVLGLTSDEATRCLWPHEFELTLTVEIGQELRVALTTSNASDENCEVSAALHSYFQTSDVDQVRLLGLEDAEYVDKLQDHARCFQSGVVTIDREIDRVYLGKPDTLTIEDSGFGRNIMIQSGGSASTIVWNPWVDKAIRTEDFPDAGFRKMICVETANAIDDLRVIKPGYDHTLSQVISV